MSCIRSTSPPNQPTRLAVIIPFTGFSLKKEQFQPCIFCGKTMRVQKFKDKTVCIHCLRQIPEIFFCS